ncbi:MAG TPA: family 43 glycosylhydrolase [Arachnia sp.]|nr:family 43 glycosylhydrolase [Arachnia sp.]HMT87115.1 family 43 glycosylhydrolase [Arachnia sp.]
MKDDPTPRRDLVNPAVRGFAPDPAAVRVGDWYYLATSSFQWFPTIPLFRSRDLVDWEPCGSVEGAAPSGNLRGIPDSAGIWAPALSHDGERFWLTYAIVGSLGTRQFDLTVYVTRADRVEGPWDEPVAVASHGFDPSVFHHDGRHWLLNLQNDPRPGGRRFDGIVAVELAADKHGGLTATGRTLLLHQQELLIEGPKMIHRDGWFYLILAEGGTGVEHGVKIGRSRSLEGPYEFDPEPLLTTRDDPTVPLQKAGHAELLQAADGRWHLVFLCARPVDTPSGPRNVLGRETGIEALTWVDGWPRLAAGGHHPRVVVPAAELPPRAASAGHGDDSSAPLGLAWPWNTLRAPVGPWAREDREGVVTLTGRDDIESLWDVSLLARRLREHRALIGVTVEANPVTFTQSAGLTLIYQADAYLAAHVGWAEPEGEPQRGQQWDTPSRGRRVVRLIHAAPGTEPAILAEREIGTGPVRLEASVEPTTVQVHVDGEPLGPEVDVTALSDDAGGLRFTGTMVGISAHDPVDRSWTATFSDWTMAEDPIDPWGLRR